MTGMDATTGKSLGGIAYLEQSIADILRTPIGSRGMRRTYGSRLYQLVDAPLGAATRTELIAATAEALDAWEPQFKLTRVTVRASKDGQASIDVAGDYLPDGSAVTLEAVWP